MSVNKDKTQSLVISSSTKDTSWKPEIKAGTYDVKTVEFYKFLGIDIDQGLRFNQHVKRIVEKTRKRVNILKSMFERTGETRWRYSEPSTSSSYAAA